LSVRGKYENNIKKISYKLILASVYSSSRTIAFYLANSHIIKELFQEDQYILLSLLTNIKITLLSQLRDANGCGIVFQYYKLIIKIKTK